MHQLVIEIVLDTFGNITIEPMSLEGGEGILERNGECSTRDRRPISLGRRLSSIVDGVVD